jgi:hypothetical protein
MQQYRIIFTFFLLLILVGSLDAQYLMEDKGKNKESSPEGNRWVFGGDFGIMLGSYTYINLSPTVGYRFTNRFTSGVGITYLYLKEELSYVYAGGVTTYTHSANIYGGKVFASYALLTGLAEKLSFSIGEVFLYSEYEPLNVDKYEFDNGLYQKNGRIWAHGALVGGGVSLPMGRRSAVRLMYLYNLNESLYSPYQNPIIRVNLIF